MHRGVDTKLCRPIGLRICAGFAMLAAALVAPGRVAAQAERESPPCMGLVSSRQTMIHRAALGSGEVVVSFLGHSTFLIESPGGVRIATDYNDYVPVPVVPDIATMNKAHSTHYTDRPDPAIKHVLRGWNPAGGPARHDVTVGDVRVRNVPTGIREDGGGTQRDGNSIFVFETAGLCVAHLGHLHHTLLPSHLQRLGRIDVVLVPVDGSWTLDLDGSMEVLKALNAPLIIPMHYFGPPTLNRFLDRARRDWPVEISADSRVVISRAMLADHPKVLVLPGR